MSEALPEKCRRRGPLFTLLSKPILASLRVVFGYRQKERHHCTFNKNNCAFTYGIFTKQRASPMAGKPKGREFTLNMRTSKPPRYRCLACGGPRSPSYHLRHPPSEPRPAPGLCRECFEMERRTEPLPVSTVTIHEIHHYHTYICQHGQHCMGRAENPPQEQVVRPVELPILPACPAIIELSGEEQGGKFFPPSQLLERPPPQAMPLKKPSFCDGFHSSGIFS